jgi:uroporphyrinogen-III synthase
VGFWDQISENRTLLYPNPMQNLANKTILVTRSLSQSSDFTALLEAQGATVIEMPALEILPPSSWEDLDKAIEQLPSYDWLILTSGNAVNYFTLRLLALERDYRDLHHLKVAVVGEKTAQFLKWRGLRPDYVPSNFVADALVEHFPDNPQGQRLLFPRVESGGRELLVKAFTDRGAIVTEVAAYQSGCPQAADSSILTSLENDKVNIITFASSKTVKHFCKLIKESFGEHWRTILDPVLIASIGPQTSLTCHELLGRVDIEAEEYTLPGLTQAIVEFVSQNPVI